MRRRKRKEKERGEETSIFRETRRTNIKYLILEILLLLSIILHNIVIRRKESGRGYEKARKEIGKKKKEEEGK